MNRLFTTSTLSIFGFCHTGDLDRVNIRPPGRFYLYRINLDEWY